MRREAILPLISNSADPLSSERLARRWFAAVTRGAFDELPELLHDDVELVSKIRTGTFVQGREDVARFIADFVAPSLYDAAVELYTPLDDERVIVEAGSAGSTKTGSFVTIRSSGRLSFATSCSCAPSPLGARGTPKPFSASAQTSHRRLGETPRREVVRLG